MRTLSDLEKQLLTALDLASDELHKVYIKTDDHRLITRVIPVIEDAIVAGKRTVQGNVAETELKELDELF